jgi:hypothetical protein
VLVLPSLAVGFNPFKNVLALRKTVILLWFPLMPLLYWTSGPPPSVLKWAALRRNWYEIAYWSHQIVAIVTVILALSCRFDVFYPAGTWLAQQRPHTWH